MSSNRRKQGREVDREVITPLAAFQMAIQKPEEAEPIALDVLTGDDDIQVRMNGVNQDKVQEYATRWEAGSEPPPIVVYEIDDDERYVIVDGYHRVTAAWQVGHETIQAIIRRGTFSEARTEAENANLNHGIQLTNDDKYNLLKRRVADGREWFEWEGDTVKQLISNREIARKLGVSPATIGRQLEKIINGLTVSNETVTVDKSGAVGADGRAIDTTEIAKTAARVAAEKPPTPEQTTPEPETNDPPPSHGEGENEADPPAQAARIYRVPTEPGAVLGGAFQRTRPPAEHHVTYQATAKNDDALAERLNVGRYDETIQACINYRNGPQTLAICTKWTAEQIQAAQDEEGKVMRRNIKHLAELLLVQGFDHDTIADFLCNEVVDVVNQAEV